VQIEEWCLGEAEVYTWRRLGAAEAAWERKQAEQRAIMDKVASRKRASQRARAGKSWRGLKAKRFNLIKGAGSVARRATLQMSAQSGEGQLSLFGVSMMKTRGNFGQNLAKPSNCYPWLYRRLLTSRFRRPIKETGRRSWWSRVWCCGIIESLESS